MHRQFALLLGGLAMSTLVCPILCGAENSPLVPSDIIQKAIRASGGKEKLQQFSAHHTRAKGTYYQGEARAQVRLDYWSQVPNKSRTEVFFFVDGQQTKLVRVFNGKQAWFLMADGNWREGSKIEIKNLRQAELEDQVRLLYPLLEKSKYQLKTLGESKINDEDALGIQVASKGYSDVNLYFAKKNGLLLKAEMRIVPREGEKEALQERFYSDYKTVRGGVKFATKQSLFYDGKKESELELIDTTPLDKIKDSLFEKQ